MAALLIDGECYGSSSVDHWKVLKELERLISVPQFTVRCFYVEYDLNKELCNHLLKAPPFGPKYEIENVSHECIFSKMIECCEGTNCRTILVVSNNTTVLHGAWFVESKGIKVYIISNAGETDAEFIPYRIADQENKTITIDDIIARYRVVPVNATKRKFGDSDAPPLEGKRPKLSEVSQLPNSPKHSTNLLSEVIALKKERKFEFQQSLGGDPKIHNLVYRVKLIVSNALIEAVNGEYTYYGVMNKGGYFQKSGVFLPAKCPGKFMIYRCRVSFNNFKWFLSFVLSGTRAGGSSDHNFYFSDGQNKGCALPVDKWYCMTNNYKNDRDMTVTAEWPNDRSSSSSLNQNAPLVLQEPSSQWHPTMSQLPSSRPPTLNQHQDPQQPQPSVAFSTRKFVNQQQTIVQPYHLQQSTAAALNEPKPPRSQRIIQPYDVPYATTGENSTRAAHASTEQSERDEVEDEEDRNMRVNRHILRVRAGQEDRNKYEENTLDSLLYLRRTTLSVVNSSIANVNGVYEYAGIMNDAGIYEKAVGKDLYVVYRCRMNSKEFPYLWFLSLLVSGTERDIQPGGKEGQHFYFSVGDDEDIPVPYKPWSSLQITFRTDTSITVSVNTIPIASTEVSATMSTTAAESLAPLSTVQPPTPHSNILQAANGTTLETYLETACLEVTPALRIAPCLTVPSTSNVSANNSTTVTSITTHNSSSASSGSHISAGGNSAAGGNIMHVIEDVVSHIPTDERQLAADRIKATVDAMRVRNANTANTTAVVHPVTAPTAAETSNQITQSTISLSTLSAVSAGAVTTGIVTTNSCSGQAGINIQPSTTVAREDWDAVKADIQQCASFSPISADDEDGFRTAASAETERIAMIAKLKQARKMTLENEFDLPQWSHLSYLRQSSLLVKNCCKKNSKANGEFKFWRLMNSAACYEMQTNNGRYVIYRCKLERNKQTWFAWFLSYIRDVDSSGQRRTDLQFPGPKDYQCYFAPCSGSPVPDQPWQNMDANDSSNIAVVVRSAVKPATSFAQSSAFQFTPPTPRIYNYQNSGTASSNHYSSGHQTPSFSQLGGATPMISSTPVHHLNWALGEDWRLTGTGNPASGGYVGQSLPVESPRIRFADNILDNSANSRSMQSPYIRPTTDHFDTDRSLPMQSPHHSSHSSSATPRHYLSEDTYDNSNISRSNSNIRTLGSKSPRHSSSTSSEPINYGSTTPRHYLSEEKHGGSGRLLGNKSPRHSNYEYDHDRYTTQRERNSIRSGSSGRVVVDRPSSAPRRSDSADRNSGASWRRNQEKMISFLHSTRESADFDTDFEWKPPKKFSFLEDRSLVVKKSEKSDGTYHFAGMLNGAAMFTLPLKEGSYCIYKCDFLESTAEKGPKHVWFLSYVRENCRPGGRKDENYYYCEDKESGRLLPEGGEWWSMMRNTFMKDRRLSVTVERSLGPIAAIELIPCSLPNNVPAGSDTVPNVPVKPNVPAEREITSKHDAQQGTNQSDERNNSSSAAKDVPPSTQPVSIQNTESSQLPQVVHLDGGPRPSTGVHPIIAFLSSSTTTKPIVPVTVTSVKTISAVSIATTVPVATTTSETTAQTPLSLLTTMFPRISTVQAECALQQCTESICSELSAEKTLTQKATSLCLAYFQKLYQRQRAKSHFSSIKSSAVDLSQSIEEYDVQSIRILTSLFPSLSADQVETDLFNVTLEVEALGEAFKDELAILPVFYHCQLLNELQKMCESKVRI